ncbi:MAG TPA: hypothetical protein VGH27_03010, partial [Streptosporangiaceae bacterium]
ASAAVLTTTRELSLADDEQAEQMAMVISEVFRGPVAVAEVSRQTLLEMLQAEIAQQVAVLGDPGLTGTGQSSVELLGVSGGALTQLLTEHLLGEIVRRGSMGGAAGTAG